MSTPPLKIVYSSTRRTPIKSRTYGTFAMPPLVHAAPNTIPNCRIRSPCIQGSIPISNVITTPFRHPQLTLGMPDSPSIILTPPDDEPSGDKLPAQSLKRKSHTLLLYTTPRPSSNAPLSPLERSLQIVVLVLRLISGALDGSASALEVIRNLIQRVLIAKGAVAVPKAPIIEYAQTVEELPFIPGSYPYAAPIPHLVTLRCPINLADYSLILFLITDHLDPLLACRLNKLYYDRYVGLIYRCLVVKGGQVDGLLKGLARAKTGDEDGVGDRDRYGKKRKAKEVMMAEKICIKDAQGMRELLQVLEEWNNRHGHSQPSSNAKPLFRNVKAIHFGKQPIKDIAFNQSSSSFTGLASFESIKDYWTSLIMAFYTHIGSGDEDHNLDLGNVCLCFDLTNSPDIYRWHGTYDSTDTGISCAVDVLCSAAIQSVSVTKIKGVEVKLHLPFDPFEPIPIIPLPRTFAFLYKPFSLPSSSPSSPLSPRIPSLSPHQGLKIAKKFTITYDLDISGRIGPRQYIRPMWLHFCAVRNCYRLSNGRVGVGDGVTVRYVVPRRTKFDQSLETFWEAEGKGQWPEERWETFKKCLATRIKSTWQIEECGCK